jgi:AraC family transcriptional regulator
MRSTTFELLCVQEQERQSLKTAASADDCAGLELCGAERLAYLLRRAIKLLESDIRAASRCLQDASTLLRAESRSTAEGGPNVPRFQSGGLARWQAKLTIEYIEQNLGAKLKACELADMLAFSRGHFSRAFKRTFGVPLMTYIFGRRVERAKSMLRGTRDHLTEIALSCGFSDQSHLNRTFRRVVGMSPGLWRRTGVDAARPGASASAFPANRRRSDSTQLYQRESTSTT